VEVGRTIKGMKLKDARAKLKRVAVASEPIEYTRYNTSIGHRKAE